MSCDTVMVCITRYVNGPLAVLSIILTVPTCRLKLNADILARLEDWQRLPVGRGEVERGVDGSL